MKAKVKDIIVRTAKTFAQAFITYLTADVFFGITDLNTLKKVVLSALIGAATAGVCAVWNSLIVWLNAYFDNKIEMTETPETETEDDNG